MKKMACTFFFLPVLLMGCSDEKTIEVYNTLEGGEQSKEAKEVIKGSDEVYTGNVIFADDQLLVAVQPKPWLDFKKRKIEKKLQKEYEEQFPDLDVIVSTDYKLYWESKKLLKEEDKKKVAEKVKKLKKLAKEET